MKHVFTLVVEFDDTEGVQLGRHLRDAAVQLANALPGERIDVQVRYPDGGGLVTGKLLFRDPAELITRNPRRSATKLDVESLKAAYPDLAGPVTA